jgi:hypothetical protein
LNLRKVGLTNLITFLLALIVTLLLTYRFQILSGFEFLLGNNTYDNTIHTAILEHWFNVFKGVNSWSEVNYFFPYTKTIAQTDAYFLISIFYIPFRLLNIDPYLSTEFAGICLKIFGFISAYAFSRVVINLKHGYATLLAILFTLNNAMTIHGYRIQLATVAFLPAFAILLYLTIKYLNSNNRKLYLIYGSLFSFLFGLWCFTCLYASYFFFIFLLIFLFVNIVFNFSKIAFIVNQVKKFYVSSFFIIIAFVISLIPFVITFYPKSQESKPRSLDAVIYSTVRIEELIQVGSNNLFNYPVFQSFIRFISPNYLPDLNWEYYNMGFTLIVSILFIFGLIGFLRNFKTLKSDLVYQLGVTSFLFILLIINVFGKSLWLYVYNYFPGGKALGVISVSLIFLAFPIYVFVVSYISNVIWKKLILFPIIFVLIISEINSPLLKLDRRKEIEMNFTVSPPTIECNSFYVSGWYNQESNPGYWEWFNNQYAHNVSAMLLSQKLNIPTLNGMASFIPKDYDLVGPNGTAFSPNSDEYKERISNYINDRNLEKVCRLDLNSKIWSAHQVD